MHAQVAVGHLLLAAQLGERDMVQGRQDGGNCQAPRLVENRINILQDAFEGIHDEKLQQDEDGKLES